LIRFYDTRSSLGLVSHFAGLTAVAGFTASLAPLWASAAAVGYGVYKSVKLFKNGDAEFENLKQHPPVHRYSPNLQDIIDRLYERSGLNPEEAVVYSFKEKAPYHPPRQRTPFLRAAFGEQPFYNAAAHNLGKPYIMISEPLLKLLNDDEEEAVLAHEFLHAAAGHSYTLNAANFLKKVTSVTNNLNLLGHALSMGLAKFTLSAAAGGMAVRSLKKEKLPTRIALAGATLGVFGGAVMFVPGFATMYGAAVLLNITASAVNRSLSRSMEYQVDRKVGMLGASPVALITALRKIDKMASLQETEGVKRAKNSQLGRALSTVSNVFATHPKVEKRLKQLAQVASNENYSQAEINEALYGDIDIGDISHIPRADIEGMANSLMGERPTIPLRERTPAYACA